MQQAFERLCAAKMDSFSFVHPGGSIVEIIGAFSFHIDNVKQVDSINDTVVNIAKCSKDVEVAFSA